VNSSRCPPVRRIADQDLAGFGGLLEPGSDVHRVAKHAELALAVADGPGHGDAGVHTHPEREPPFGALADPLVGPLERGEDGERGALGLLGVVGCDQRDRLPLRSGPPPPPRPAPAGPGYPYPARID